MKTIFNTNEIPHLWVYGKYKDESIDRAYNSQRNLYFEGNVIYSYGEHFPIAIIDREAKIVEFTTDKYSRTTTQHILDVRRAIPLSYEIYERPMYRPKYRDANIATPQEYWTDKLQKMLEKAKKKTPKQCNYMNDYTVQYNLAKSNAKYFGFELPPEHTFSEKEFDEAIRRYFEFKNNKTDREIKKRENQNKKYLESVERWLNDEDVKIPYGYRPTFAQCRVEDDVVKTTQGATIKIANAKILVEEYKAGKLNDLVGRHIESFTFNSVENDHIVIGCHRIKFTEIDRFIQRYGW